jgi:6-pyruvoyltetrahydropterin/6-carboxytetrahydropterin synthase
MAARCGSFRPIPRSTRWSSGPSEWRCRGWSSVSCGAISGARGGSNLLSLTRRIEFSASHTLWRPDWDEIQNRDAFGDGAGNAQYGHNYALEVTLRGPLDPETGMVIDLKELKGIMEAEIAARFDHKNLNEDTPFFRERAPTAESLAQVIFELLDRAIPDGLLHGVRLYPTEDLYVEVTR